MDHFADFPLNFGMSALRVPGSNRVRIQAAAVMPAARR